MSSRSKSALPNTEIPTPPAPPRNKTLRNPPTPPQVKIDWYSFTIPVAGGLSGHGIDVLGAINYAFYTVFPPDFDGVSGDGTWSIEPAKGFYEWTATHRASGIAVSWGTVNAHAFVVLSGQSCDWLRLSGLFTYVVERSFQRVSRIDAAIDLHCSTKPQHFVAAGFAKRFKTAGAVIHSKTGDTVNVGNRKSDRFARVYRYAPPHPRSHLLRLEAEYKGKAAKELGKLLASSGEVDAIRAAHAPFGWLHPLLSMDFLQPALCALDLPTSPATANTDGLPRVFDRHLSDTMRRDLLTLFSGLRKKFCRHSRGNQYRRYPIDF